MITCQLTLIDIKKLKKKEYVCTKCKLKDIGDEFPYIVGCPVFFILKGKNPFPNQKLIIRIQFHLKDLWMEKIWVHYLDKNLYVPYTETLE